MVTVVRWQFLSFIYKLYYLMLYCLCCFGYCERKSFHHSYEYIIKKSSFTLRRMKLINCYRTEKRIIIIIMIMIVITIVIALL